ncbi:hypothetical protein D7Z26_15915 [Cohnella endophytica]|uniref:Uncharacterized protein n=1 Tax=Cohnella endophytica TaxID=2419778 RepID=A0A494XTR5_9BACL|nr:hypothetical protein [Cohnella endophytica]RKP53212.1 hypothetical protein D7Z26_15915 [Cohnella endophytica]
MNAILTKREYEKARQFLLTKARKLEAAQFHYEFEQGSEDEVLRELLRYQNDDGGFGKGLEPDLRCEESSALATTTAMQSLVRLTESAIPLIERAMRYFRNSYSDSGNGWDIIPKEAEQAPRAIWWEYGAFKDNWGNPNAEIAGYFNRFTDLAGSHGSEFADRLNGYALRHLRESCDLREMHEMLCYVRWQETLPAETRHEISGQLDEFVDNCVIADPGDRIGYGGYPLMVVQSTEDRYYSKYADVLPGDLDRLIESQSAEGCWSPNWAWGRYDEAWETAKMEWQGVLTLQALRTLRNFGRLERN